MFMAIIRTALLLAVCLTAAVGCTPKSEKPVATTGSNNEIATTPNAGERVAAEQVTVSRSLQFGKVNAAVYGVYKQSADIKVFEEAIKTAGKIEGILDISKPDYDIVIASGRSQRSVHLWLHPKSEIGMYTEVSDTGTGYRLTASATEKLKKLIMGQRYSSDQAEENGDVVNLHGKWSNASKWKQFVNHVKDGTADAVHVTTYTIEGDPIFQDLLFDGEKIAYTFDNTHDAFGSPFKPVSFCSTIETSKTTEGTEYRLAGCSGGESENPTFSLVMP
jgi:hypothetical protein